MTIKRWKTTCGAPCIINATAGLHIVFCEKEHGHTGDCSCTRNDEKGFCVVISWIYLGQTFDIDNYAPPLTEGVRCRTWVHGIPTENLVSDHLNFSVEIRQIHSGGCKPTSFCCEKPPGHDGDHTRSGKFGPLGIQWEIKW